MNLLLLVLMSLSVLSMVTYLILEVAYCICKSENWQKKLDTALHYTVGAVIAIMIITLFIGNGV